MNSDDMKAKELQTWSSVVPGWRKHDTRSSEALRSVSAALLDKAGVKTGHHVLDVACGTGEPAIPAAQRVGPTGSVFATDLVAGMVLLQRKRRGRSPSTTSSSP